MVLYSSVDTLGNVKHAIAQLATYAWMLLLANAPIKAEPGKDKQPVEKISPATEFYQDKKKIQQRYRQRFADEIIPFVTSAEVFLLSFTLAKDVPAGKEADYFSIKPYGMDAFTEILKRKKLNQEELKPLKEAVVSLFKEKNDADQAMCHYPIHGIRLFNKEGGVLFETSICWKCSNYYIEYPDDFETATWVGFQGKPLKKILDQVMPIPQSEIDRFNKKYGKKKAK